MGAGVHFGGDVEAIAEYAAVAVELIGKGCDFFMSALAVVSGRRQHDADQALLKLGDVVEMDCALSFGHAQATAGDQSREAAVGCPAGGVEEDGRGVLGDDLGADEQLQVRLFGCAVHSHGAGDRVAIGDGQGVVAEFGGALDQFVGMRRPAEKGEVGFAVELGVGLRSGRWPEACV